MKAKWRIEANPVLLNWEIFDKIYLDKLQIETKTNKTRLIVNREIETWDILEFKVRGKRMYIVKNEFLKYLAKD